VQVVIARGTGPWGDDLSDDVLGQLYSVPSSPWLRANMVTTLDGAATGADGRSGSINNAADKRVFDLLRRTADAIVVGAGTARAERYGTTDRPIVVVSRQGGVPETLAGARDGEVLLVTCATAPGLSASRESIGTGHVLIAGEDEVDLTAAVGSLHAAGLRHLLCEGGPTLLRDLVAYQLVDEVCATIVPVLVAGEAPRITSGPALGVPLELRLLLEERGTLLGRWLVSPRLTSC